MYVSAQNLNATNIISSGGTNWNMFLMSGTPPTELSNVPFQLVNMDSIYANCVQALRVTAVNNAAYGQELLVFENAGNLLTSKEHGPRSSSGAVELRCMPQAISSNINGLNKPKGYVNGLEDDTTREVLGSDILIDGKYIEYDLGSACSIKEMIYGNDATSAQNPTSIDVQYYDNVNSVWVNVGTQTSIKTYAAAGVKVSFTPVVAQRWRVVFKTNPTSTFSYRYLKFIASVLPDNVLEKESALFTWAILVPYAPTESVYESVGATSVPCIILDAGGPLDLKPVVLNRGFAGINDYVSSIHCKVFSSVVSEVEVVV